MTLRKLSFIRDGHYFSGGRGGRIPKKDCLLSLNHQNKLFASLPKKKNFICRLEFSEAIKSVLTMRCIIKRYMSFTFRIPCSNAVRHDHSCVYLYDSKLFRVLWTFHVNYNNAKNTV